jgi:regulation of enolase protein 1 (concanavalin A-like superfamily)
MRGPSRGLGAAVVAVAILLAGSGTVGAQPAPPHRTAEHFIRTKKHVLNPDTIRRVEFGNGARATVYFAEGSDVLVLVGEDAEQLRAAFGGPRGGDGGSRLLAFDDFDGKLHLNWKPVRPDPTHVSLEKNAGKLTITTQRGSIHGEEKKDEYGEGVQARNIYLIDNPLAGDADFVATTCVAGLTPAAPYQQAGLIAYDDDDNYLKLDYEFNWGKGEGQNFFVVAETAARPDHHPVAESEQALERYWLRLTKRGKVYEYATSTDGATFRAQGTVEWGDGAPKRIGILAKNGGNKDAPEVDAAFEFFELRSIPPKRGDAGKD